MSEIDKILKGLNERRPDIENRVRSVLLNTKHITNLGLLQAIRYLLAAAALEAEIEFDPKKLEREIFGDPIEMA